MAMLGGECCASDLADRLLLGNLGRADRGCGVTPVVSADLAIHTAAIPFRISRLQLGAHKKKGMIE